MEDLNQTIDFFFRQWAQEFVNNRKKDIVARDLRNTDSLLRSLYVKVTTEPEAGVFFLRVYAKTYGRYQDMSRRYAKAGGNEMIESLKQWVEQEGESKFKRGKYASIMKDYTPQQVQNAVAWGIVKQLPKRQGTRKRGWWNRGKTRDIENFYDLLLRLMQEGAAGEIQKP